MSEPRTLDAACEETQRRLEIALKSVNRLASGLKAGQKAAKTGDLAALHRALAELNAHVRIVRTETENARDSWDFSEEEEVAYFADGNFTQELLADAEAAGLQMSLEDSTLVCYPSLVKVDAGKRCVIIDRKPYKSVRPASLVAHLKAVQSRPPRFRPAPFLDALYVAWDHARHLRASGQLPGMQVRVDHVYAALTIAPGASKEYSKPEFGRDLYLLEMSGELVTRKGARVNFGRSTGTKTSGVITVVGDDGRRFDYSSIGFEA